MGRITKLRDLIGVIKDKASLSKAALLSKPNTVPLHLAVLRSTTHSPYTPPDDNHLSTLLSLGDSSRATASALIESLMDRLHRTRDSSVALKCLLTIHHIIKRGPFILQDQLSIFPTSGGRNHLKLSSFYDGSSATTWALSTWVRWYARYLEILLSASRILGFYICSSSSNLEKENLKETISSFMNVDLIRAVDSLIGVIEEICKVPDHSLLVEGNKLLYEVMGLLGSDYLSLVNEILLRLGEFNDRLNCLSFGESVELVCFMKRLEDCKERLLVLFTIKKASIEALWGLIGELKKMVGSVDAYRGGGKLVNVDRRERASESARFGERVVNSSDSLQFSSGRFGLQKFSFVILEST